MTGERLAYVVSIDIKDGYYDVIHAFSSEAAAKKYLAWEADHVGDHAFMSVVPLEDDWDPPSSESQAGLFGPALGCRLCGSLEDTRFGVCYGCANLDD